MTKEKYLEKVFKEKEEFLDKYIQTKNKMKEEIGFTDLRTSINYCAVGDNILIDPKLVDETESGIKLIGKAKEENKAIFPEVISIGEKITTVKVGDFIAADGTAIPNLVEIDGKKYFSIKEYQVIGVLYNKPNSLEVN